MKPCYLGFSALFLLAATRIAVAAEDIPTRFGTLTIDDDNILLFNGTPVNPEVRGNNSLSVINKFMVNAADVFLIQENGGTACPAQFYFVTVSPSGARPTPAFGTCSDLIKVARNGETISVSMPGVMGPFEPNASKIKASREKHVFTFNKGMVIEAGKPSDVSEPSAVANTAGREPTEGATAFCRALNEDQRLRPLQGIIALDAPPTLEMQSNPKYISDDQTYLRYNKI